MINASNEIEKHFVQIIVCIHSFNDCRSTRRQDDRLLFVLLRKNHNTNFLHRISTAHIEHLPRFVSKARDVERLHYEG
jgi:hypothetical protein